MLYHPALEHATAYAYTHSLAFYCLSLSLSLSVSQTFSPALLHTRNVISL